MRRNILGAIVVAGSLVLLTSATSFAQSSAHRVAKPAPVIAPAALKAPVQPEPVKPATVGPAAQKPAAPNPEVDATEVETADVEKPETAQHDTGTTDHQSATEQGDHQD